MGRRIVWLLLNSLGAGGGAFLLTVLIGRSLGGDSLGRYGAVMAWMFPLTLLADFGAATLLTRQVAANPAQTGSYLPTALYLRWLWGGGLVILVWIFAPWLARDAEIVTGLRIAAPMLLIDALFGVYAAIWRGYKIFWPLPLLNAAYWTLQNLGVGWVIYRGGEIQQVLWAVLLADSVQLGLTWRLWRRLKPTTPTIAAIPASAFINQSAPFALAGILAAGQSRLPFLLLEALTTPAALGLFAAAMRFIEALRLFPFAVFGAIFPTIAAGEDEGQGRIVAFLTLYSLGAAGVLMWVGEPLLRVILGPEFIPATRTLILLALALIPSLMRQTIFVRLYAGGGEKRANLILAGLLISQAILGGFLIPRYGAEGAAFVILIGEIILLPFIQKPVVSGRR